MYALMWDLRVYVVASSLRAHPLAHCPCISCLLPFQESTGAEEEAEEASVTTEQLRHNAPVVALEWSHGDLHSGMALPAVLFRSGEPVLDLCKQGRETLT